MSYGFIKETLDFEKLQHMLDAAKALYMADDIQGSKETLNKLAEVIHNG